MAKLPKLTGNELAKIVEKLGFIYFRTSGSHMTYKHSDGRKTTIPHHAGQDLGPGLLSKIIRYDLKISREEFEELL
tara:strand:+ start:491 stop:718 length:228 start_codon:yes stop_codon:yes gene_type:complete